MRDVRLALRKKYNEALQGLQVWNPTTGTFQEISFYYQQHPNVYEESYILMTIPANVGNNTKSSFDPEPSVRLTIETTGTLANNGIMASNIVDKILETIYPTPQSKMDLSDFDMEMVSMALVDDVENDYVNNNQMFYIQRVLTFRHKIFITA